VSAASRTWMEKPVGFCENRRNRPRSILPVFYKPVSESDFFLKNGLPVSVPVLPIGFNGFQPLLADRFTGFGTDLLVINI
jgi:hypothetical protein